MGSKLVKGAMYLTFAQIFFSIAGYLTHMILGRSLGPSLYGVFGVVMSILIISEILLIGGPPRAISKYVAESKLKAISVLRQGLKAQYIFAVMLTILLIVFSRTIANILRDSSLTIYIIAVSFLIIPKAITSVYSKGFLNGFREFGKQSIVSLTDSVFKIIFVVLLVLFLGFNIFGAIFSYILSSVISLFLAIYFVKRYIKDKKLKDQAREFRISKIIKFSVPIIILYAVYLLLMNLDILFVKTLLNDNLLVGYYTAANTLSKAPYFLFSATSLTLLPSISRAIARKKKKLTKKYINFSLRYLILFLLPIISLVSATSGNTISLFYGTRYLGGASSLSILIFGLSLLLIFATMSTIIIARGKPKIAMTFALVLLPISIILNLILIPIFKLNGAPLATLITASIGVILASLYIIKKFKTLVNPLSLLRIFTASFVIYIISLNWQFTGKFVVFTYAILLLLYVAILFLIGEIRKKDILEITKYLSK